MKTKLLPEYAVANIRERHFSFVDWWTEPKSILRYRKSKAGGESARQKEIRAEGATIVAKTQQFLLLNYYAARVAIQAESSLIVATQQVEILLKWMGALLSKNDLANLRSTCHFFKTKIDLDSDYISANFARMFGRRYHIPIGVLPMTQVRALPSI